MQTKTQPTVHEVIVENMGPIHEAGLFFKRGVNLIKGDHGAGKSTVINLLERRFGDGDAAISVRDGTDKGSFKWNGETVLTVGKVVRKTGKVELRLSSSSPFSRLIDPGYETPETNNRQRVSALLEMVRVAVTEDMVRTLIGDDVEIFEYVSAKVGIEFLEAMNIVNATDSVRLSIHELKRWYEVEATKAEGELGALKETMVLPENLTDISVEDATSALDTATRKHERLSGEADQRAAREAERAKILALNLQAPNLEGAKDRVTDAYQKKVECDRVVAEARHALELAELNATSAALAHTEAVDALQTLESDSQTYYERKAILESEITGATEDDVAAAQADVDTSTANLEAARASDLYRKQRTQQDDARKKHSKATAEAKRFKLVATSVTSRLAKILADLGLPNLTIDGNGELCVVHADDVLEPFARLSFGQMTRLAAELFAKSSEDGAVLTIGWRFWAALNEAMQAEVHKIIWEQDLFAAVEVASDGELRVEQFAAEVAA